MSLSRIFATSVLVLSATGAFAADGLLMPDFDSQAGRLLFASKGCVVCHSINGVGGEDAPALDFDAQNGPMNPFDFAARMWRGAGPMIMMQEDELGEQISLTGADLAAIIAFAHDSAEQAKFTAADIPDHILELMQGDDEEDSDNDN